MSRLEDENAAAGSKGDNKKENVRCEVLFCWEELRFQKNYMRIGARKLLRMGLVLARVWRGQKG